MNKATKGAIAAGAAGILLLGGAGSFALWEESKTLDAGGVSTGALTLALGPGVWADATAGSAGTIADIQDFAMVPGDTVTYTTAVTVTATGDNLQGELKLDDSALAATVDGAPVDYVDVTMDSDAESVTGLDVVGDEITFDAAGTYTINVVVTVVFNDVADLVGQDAYIDLSQIAVKLEQA